MAQAETRRDRRRQAGQADRRTAGGDTSRSRRLRRGAGPRNRPGDQRSREADRAHAGALHRRRSRVRQIAQCQETHFGASGAGRPDANERARLRKRRNAGLSLPGNQTALYGSMSSAVASGRKTTSGYRVAVDASLAMLMPKPSPTRCIKVSRPTPWRSIEGLRPKAVVRRTM